MGAELAFLIVTILIFVFLAAGMFIHSILLAAGMIGILLLESPAYMASFLQSDPFIRVASYSLTTVPMFVLMAQFIVQCGIIEDIYNLVYNISRGRRGILGVLTVIAGGVLGAVSGSATASSAAMAQVATPQLMRRGYQDGIAGATVAAASSLSSVIPPSVILILWGVATDTPIGNLFIGSLIPGIIMMVIICVIMLIHLKLTENKTAQQKVAAFQKEPIPASRAIISIILTFLVVFVVFYGIYAGVFTPTEAGAIGALIGFIVALILRKVNWNFLVTAFSETVKITAMILMIMIGAQIFGRFVSVSLLPRKLIDLLGGLMDYPVIIIVILCVIYFILFMFVEGSAVILMTAAIVLPLVKELGLDTIWFGVFVGILCTIGLITPPVGLCVYSVSGATGISSEKIFKHAFPYAIILTILMTALMIIFPEIATWLPSKM